MIGRESIAPRRLCTPASNRAPRSLSAESGTGFGAQKPPKAPEKRASKGKRQSKQVTVTQDNNEAVQKALKFVGGNNSAPIDQRQASKGRIDFAKVRDWGSGKPEELQSLQVESFKAGKAGSGAQEQSFYVQLTYAVAQATEQGRVNEILYNELPVRGRQNLPEFAKWSFSKACYVQYLLDQQRLHHVLESSIAEALAVNQEAPSVAAALGCFSEARGLDRSLEIAADLTNLTEDGQSVSADRQNGAASATDPTAAAESYAKYLSTIGSACVESASISDRNQACLKLIAHAFTNQLILLTRGSIIGKKFADKLGLIQKHAVNLYRSYPFDRMGKDPFEALKRNASQAGTHLSDAEKEMICNELPLAMAHTVQTWEPLARST